MFNVSFLVTKIKLKKKENQINVKMYVKWSNLYKKYLGIKHFNSVNAVGESVALMYKDEVVVTLSLW